MSRPASSSLLASLPAGCVAHCCKPAPGLMLFKRTSQMPPPLAAIFHFDPDSNNNKIKIRKETWMKYEWRNAASLSTVLGSSLQRLSQWRPIRTGWGSFLCTAVSFLRLRSLHPYPAEQMTSAVTYLFMLSGSFWDTFLLGWRAQKLHAQKKGKILPLRSLYYPAEPVLWLLWKCCRAYWYQPNQFGAVVQYEQSRKRHA